MTGRTNAAARPLPARDEAPTRSDFRADVLAGLSRSRRTLPCKYLYDAAGARLFDEICALEEYYPPRAERRILRDRVRDIARIVGPRTIVVEFGSGSAVKTELLLGALEAPSAYVPIDISREQLLEAAQRLSQRFPELQVLPVCADYTRALELPRPSAAAERTLVFFPGSTIGNFEPAEALAFLRHVAQMVGPGGAALIGVDRQKDSVVLERAYDDAAGVTAAFNLNLLARINRELGANFQLDRFSHRAIYNADAGRIEMHLVSGCDQIVRLPDTASGPMSFAFRRGEHIVTEHSYKYTVEGFAALACKAGLAPECVWSDPDQLFSVFLLRA